MLPCVLVATAVFAADEGAVVKTFTDKGSVYVRTEKVKLKVGDELLMMSDGEGSKPAGHAVVMEVNGPLARVSLDEEADAAKAKFVKVGKSAAPPKAPVAPSGASATLPRLPSKPPPPPVPAASPAPAEQPAMEPRAVPATALKGRLESNPFRAKASNDSDRAWSDCEFRYSDGSHYSIGTLSPGADESVVRVKFSYPPDPPFDFVTVKCAEGEAKFSFADPSSKQPLSGYAERDGSRVTVHNDGNAPWSRCDVRKPDGSHYVMGTLKAHDTDSARGGAFKKENDPGVTSLMLVCTQGQLSLSLR